jgi:phosphate transport system permease protein
MTNDERKEIRPSRGAAGRANYPSIPKLLSALAILIILAMLAMILWNVIYRGAVALSLDFFTTPPEQGMEAGGILPAIIGTLLSVMLMTIFAVPIGVVTAIYLAEYAEPNSRFRKTIELAVANLAGVPSIVLGLFGLGFFINFVGDGIDNLLFAEEVSVWGQPALIWASLTLALLTLPIVVTSTQSALHTVPGAMKEASYALGATKLQTLWGISIPRAVPGILVGTILAVSRAAGAVAPIMFTGVAYYLPYLPTSPDMQFMSLSYHVYALTTQSPDFEATETVLYGTVLVLLLLTFSLNLIAIMIRSRLRRELPDVR